MSRQIAFSHPRRGLEGIFVTFRLGTGLATLTPGDPVELVDSRSKKLLKHATVRYVYKGTLDQMAFEHGAPGP